MEDVICLTSSENPVGNPFRFLVFFITGNPGLVEYYRTFLNSLHTAISDQNLARYHCVYGASLAGFELNDSTDRKSSKRQPLNLHEQIDDVYALLMTTTRRFAKERQASGEENLRIPSVKVVLVGHSVGAYILLKILEKWQTSSAGQQDSTEMQIVGGVCLFPTVVDLAKSQSGVRAGPVVTLPYFAFMVHYMAKIFTFWMPLRILTMLVQYITGFPRHAATITAAFVRSKYGVYQALHLAKHELEEMNEDCWSDELWGVGTAFDRQEILQELVQKTKTKLFFYYGANDHWIADSTRDQLIVARAHAGKEGDGGKPIMEIDQNGVPHSFCIRHSDLVAKKVVQYIRLATHAGQQE